MSISHLQAHKPWFLPVGSEAEDKRQIEVIYTPRPLPAGDEFEEFEAEITAKIANEPRRRWKCTAVAVAVVIASLVCSLSVMKPEWFRLAGSLALVSGKEIKEIAAEGRNWLLPQTTSTNWENKVVPQVGYKTLSGAADHWLKTATIGRWNVKCDIANTRESQACILAQNFLVEQIPVRIALAEGSDGHRYVFVHLPGTVERDRVVRLSFRDIEFPASLQKCDETGCFARIRMSDEFRRHMGEEAVMSFEMPDRMMRFRIDLQGYEESLEAAQENIPARKPEVMAESPSIQQAEAAPVMPEPEAFKQTFGRWEMSCVGYAKCDIEQTLKLGKSGKLKFVVSLSATGSELVRMALQNVKGGKGLAIVGTRRQFTIPFDHCNGPCIAEKRISPEFRSELLGAGSLTVSLQDGAEGVAADVILSGLPGAIADAQEFLGLKS